MQRFVRNAEVGSSSLLPSTNFSQRIHRTLTSTRLSSTVIYRHLSLGGIPALFPILLVLLLATGCGHDPLAPSAPTVRLSVLVVSSASGHPIAGEPVLLATEQPLPHLPFVRRVTGRDGIASWTVTPGRAYPMVVRNLEHFADVVVVADSQWLLSVPE